MQKAFERKVISCPPELLDYAQQVASRLGHLSSISFEYDEDALNFSVTLFKDDKPIHSIKCIQNRSLLKPETVVDLLNNKVTVG